MSEKPKWRVIAKSNDRSPVQQTLGEFDTKAQAASYATERRTPKTAIVRNGRDYIITLPA